jgi:hypothetical protein
MKITEKYDIGIACSTPELLQERLLVSGLTLLSPDEAFSKGFGKREVIAPTGFRRAEEEELRAIIATKETEHVVKLVRVASEVGRTVANIAKAPGYTFDMTAPPTDFGFGISGIPGGVRHDDASMSSVTRDENGLLVGDHINTRPYKNMKAALINNGPGPRWHRITPSSLLNAETFDGETPGPMLRAERMRELLKDGRAGELLSYAVRINEPFFNDVSQSYLSEALVGSPVTRYLHDGSTGPAHSEVTFIVSPIGQDPWAYHPTFL